MNPIELANRALNYLKEKYYSTPSTELYTALDLHEWPERLFLMDCMKRLERNGIVSKSGSKKYFWRILNSDWDLANPFGGIGAPKVRKTRGMNANKEAVIAKLVKDEVESQMEDMVLVAFKKAKKSLETTGIVKSELTIKSDTGVVLGKIEGKLHSQYMRCMRLAGARRNTLLIGPAGCGKTHLAGQIAKGLGLPFAHISCSAGMSEGQLMGRQLPVGDNGSFKYCRSQFVQCYEEGGVFLFDEIDAADSNTLLVINSALANGHLAVPNRMENPVAKKHPDFIAIAAANTYGTGADRQYVGRNQLDESTIDRFRIGQVEMDYDDGVECALCPDVDLRIRLQGYRTKAMSAKLERVVSTRFLQDAYIMMQAGDTIADIERALFAGWSKDELSKIGKYAGH